MLERCSREEIPAKCQIQGAYENPAMPSAGLDSSKFTSPCATYQNISSKILLGFGWFFCWFFFFKCEMPEAGDFPGKRAFPPIIKACHVYCGTLRSLNSQQLLCCLCVYFFSPVRS